MSHTNVALIKKPFFCVKAFHGLSITPSGGCAPCCLFEKMISKRDGSPYKIWEDNISEIYNSDFMKDVREKMLNDKPVEACRQCYQLEQHKSHSMRIHANEWEVQEINYNYSGNYSPAHLDLKLNNKCNLKCRMCQPRDSHLIYNEFKSIIEKDVTFSYYTNTELLDPDLKIHLKEIPEWSKSGKFHREFLEILPSLKSMAIVGGEPLYLDELYELIDICIQENVSQKIDLIITTNLMHVPLEKIAKSFSHFKQIIFNISLDAMGKELSYIRYPSDFSKIISHFEELYELKKKGVNASFQFTPTIQNYNVLYIGEVYRFVNGLMQSGFELNHTPLHLNFLEFPPHLNIRYLPKAVKERALKKLKEVADEIPWLLTYQNVDSNFKQLLALLRSEEPSGQNYISEFLNYSKVLDKERGQVGEDILPELFNLLSGIEAMVPPEPYLETRRRAWEFSKVGKLEEAIALFQESSKTSEDKEIDYREMAWMTNQLGDSQESLRLFKKAYALNPDDQLVLEGLVFQLANMNKKDHEYFDLLLKAIAKNPDNALLLRLAKISNSQKN